MLVQEKKNKRQTDVCLCDFTFNAGTTHSTLAKRRVDFFKNSSSKEDEAGNSPAHNMP